MQKEVWVLPEYNQQHAYSATDMLKLKVATLQNNNRGFDSCTYVLHLQGCLPQSKGIKLNFGADFDVV